MQPLNFPMVAIHSFYVLFYVNVDPDGLPALAAKQKKYFMSWMRPDDICEDPKMVYLVSSFTVKQVCVSVCVCLSVSWYVIGV